MAMELPITKSVVVSYSTELSKSNADLAIVVIDETHINNGQVTDESLKNLDKHFDGVISGLVALKDFQGKWLQIAVSLCKSDVAKRILLIGAGKKSDFAPARARAIGVKASECAGQLKANNTIFLGHSALLNTKELYLQSRIGFGMGIYNYPNSNLSNEAREILSSPLNVTFVVQNTEFSEHSKKYDAVSESVQLCRLLQDGPPNIVNPSYVSQIVSQEARSLGLNVNIMGKKELEKLGFGAMLAVAGGSAQEPQFVVVEYKPKQFKKTLAFVGKGLTMDTGGYSLKTPSVYQEGMKYDMSGAAVSLSSVLAIAKLGLNVHVYGVAALCENMVDAHSYRVGDVLTSYSGKTIEVIDTDAEGRVVLSDALHYTAKDLKPDYIVEYSTLTGAMIVALGHLAAGLFATDSEIEKVVEQASEFTGERIHAFPIWEEICEDVKGKIADLQNVCPGKRWAGSMVAAAFLKEFVNDVPYAHLDIAGVADGHRGLGYPHKGGSGYGVQLSVRIAELLQ